MRRFSICLVLLLALASGNPTGATLVPQDSSCTQEECGNFNGDAGNVIDISDLFDIVGYLYKGDDPPFKPCAGDVDTCALTTLRDVGMLVTYCFIYPEVVREDFNCSASQPPIVGTPGVLQLSLVDSIWAHDSTQFSSILRVTASEPIGALTLPLKIFLYDTVSHQLLAPDSIDVSGDSPYSGPYVMERVINLQGSCVQIVDVGEPSLSGVVDWSTLTLTMDPPPEHDLRVVLSYTTRPPQEYNAHSGQTENVNYPMGLDLRKPFNVWKPGGLADDSDGDGIPDPIDNCPDTPNSDQVDTDSIPPGDACCCVGLSGNVDGDTEELVDIGDLTALISYLYIPPNPVPGCPDEANVDGDGERLIDIGDLTALISYLYIPPNPAPATCP
jgi:hypothetical protein